MPLAGLHLGNDSKEGKQMRVIQVSYIWTNTLRHASHSILATVVCVFGTNFCLKFRKVGVVKADN